MKIYKFTILLFLTSLVANANEITILFLGDSLTEGYGIDKESAYPTKLKELISNKESKTIEIINGGITGSTTASGISRLKWYQRAEPNIVVLALGANDGLRGIPIEETEKNLQKMIDKLRKWNCEAVICGMKMPPNYGESYRQPFESLFPRLAKENNISLVPFLLESVAGEKDKNIEDGIHPNEAGHEIMAENIYSIIKDLL